MEEKKDLLKDFIPQLKSFVKSETVFGEPYKIGDVTLIPVNSVRVGFGFGTGEIIKKTDSAGAGGGVLLTPVAFVVIKDGNISIHSLSGGTIENVIEKAPEALDKVLSIVQKLGKKKE